MKISKNSIFFNISIVYFLSVIFIGATFFVVIKNSENIHNAFLKRKYSKIINSVFFDLDKNRDNISKDTKKKLSDMDIDVLDITKFKDSELKNMQQVCNLAMPMYKFWIFKKKRYYYIVVKTPRVRVLLRDNDPYIRSLNYLYIAFAAIIVILFLSYLSILRKLYPIKLLKENIKKLGNEDFETDFTIKGSDEVAILWQEFDNSLKKLKKIKESRNIFLRNIMHELKTPIAKGKFLTKLPKTKDNEEKMDRVFIRLETLINEFATIEELISDSSSISKKEYYLIDIIDNAIDLLMIDGKDLEIIEKEQNKKVKVNFKLFSIAVKNLLDNGLKYLQDGKVSIVIEKDKILFINSGDQLKHNIEKYFEPFFKDQKIAQQSFGLGLYIVYNILKSHDMRLDYSYDNKKHIFTIVF